MIVFVIGIAFAGGIYAASRRNAVHAGNVNEDWEGASSSARVPVAA